jgi:hypothetical protein
MITKEDRINPRMKIWIRFRSERMGKERICFGRRIIKTRKVIKEKKISRYEKGEIVLKKVLLGLLISKTLGSSTWYRK